MGSDVVVAFSSDAFGHNDLLAKHLAGHVAGFDPTSACSSSFIVLVPAMDVVFACAVDKGGTVNHLRGDGSSEAGSTESLLVSSTRRIPYRFIDSNTGGRSGVEVESWLVGRTFEVVVTAPAHGGQGISECT